MTIRPQSQGVGIGLATRLINLGARIQLLQKEVGLSREILIRLYKEIKGKSPPKGMLPFSQDWYITWLENVHSSLFMTYYEFLKNRVHDARIEILIKAYEMYTDEVSRHANYKHDKPVLSFVRAWTMVGFMDVGLLRMTPCTTCTGHFVTRTDESPDFYKKYRCGFCNMPSRATKTYDSHERKARLLARQS